jgi:signal transduction histidine kinase
LAFAVVFSLLRARAMRRSVSGLVVDLDRGGAAGGMREVLAEWLHDPSLQVAYAVDGSHRDLDLTRVDVSARPGRGVSRLTEGGEEIAVLVHRPGLLDNPEALREVVTAARLGLENERLRAEGLAQARVLAQSRVRERRRLERDLHDGAQQRLLGLLLGLRLLRSKLGDGHPEVDRAEAEIGATIGDLRELAAGLFPHVLLTDGLAGALTALGEEAQLRVDRAPEGRLPAVVETTAYLVVAKAVQQGPTTVEAANDGDSLRVLADVACAGVSLAGLEDRVAALGGSIRVEPADVGSRVVMELPCSSSEVRIPATEWRSDASRSR